MGAHIGVFVHQRHILNANVIDILTVQFPAVTLREARHPRLLSRDCLIAYPQRPSSLLEPYDLVFFPLCQIFTEIDLRMLPEPQNERKQASISLLHTKEIIQGWKILRRQAAKANTSLANKNKQVAPPLKSRIHGAHIQLTMPYFDDMEEDVAHLLQLREPGQDSHDTPWYQTPYIYYILHTR